MIWYQYCFADDRSGWGGGGTTYAYDADSRLTTLANLKSDNSVISKFDYQYGKVATGLPQPGDVPLRCYLSAGR
ncbi:hypothetical protein AB1L42_17885 [Thalassoglobus sp. JC818]|uniref:hypothetical protein n=1 Tax=Thalassoglobus sp. JC818 TaxID=3232136 RepID=UPI00345B0687